MILPNREAIDELEALAETEPEQLLSVAGLVKSRFMQLDDVDDLRREGCRFWQLGAEDDPSVAVRAGEFLAAARRVGDRRAQELIRELAPAPAPARLN